MSETEEDPWHGWAFAADGRHADEAELHQISAAWRAWAAQDDGWFAIIHGEVLCRPVAI